MSTRCHKLSDKGQFVEAALAQVQSGLWPRAARRSRRWLAAAAAWCAICAPALAWGQSGGGLFSPESGALAPPATASDELRVAEDPQVARMAEAVEEALGVYIVHSPLREALERVVVADGEAEVWFLRDLDVNPQDARCDAYRWLLLGRFGRNVGALPLFKEYSGLQRIKLVFYSLQTRVRVNARGEYEQSRTPVRELELNLSREKASALDPKALKQALGGSRDACVSNGQAVVDHYWYIR